MWLCCLLACIFFDEKCSYSYFCVSLNECVIFLCWILRSSLYPWFSENLITWLFGGGGHFLCVFSLGLSYLDLWVFSFHQIRKKLTITSSNIFPLFSLFLLGSYLHKYYTFWYWNTKCLLFYFSPFFFLYFILDNLYSYIFKFINFLSSPVSNLFLTPSVYLLFQVLFFSSLEGQFGSFLYLPFLPLSLLCFHLSLEHLW